LKIAAVIPARLESSRFPRKVLHNFCGTPMIEHVRLRAEKSNVFQAGVYVATCDTEIYELVKSNGGNPIMTSKSHSNGTSRVAEAIKDIDCSHVLVLQADEPLITPKILEEFVEKITLSSHYEAWNAISDINEEIDISNTSIVKCAVNQENRILFCFRGSPFICDFEVQSNYLKKMLGLIAFTKNSIQEINNKTEDLIENFEKIEQIRIINSNHQMGAIDLGKSFPSVNLKTDADIVLKIMNSDEEQIHILDSY
jgi:3-deoxy-manno-octulosonate cytidylyltransferase (CMP-KDO synthetase)